MKSCGRLYAYGAVRRKRIAEVLARFCLRTFTGRKGKPVYPGADWLDWCALLDDLGLPHYRVHDLRHGFATLLLEQGTDPRVVADLLGHATTALLRRYQHVRPVLHQAAADALDRALGGER